AFRAETPYTVPMISTPTRSAAVVARSGERRSANALASATPSAPATVQERLAFDTPTATPATKARAGRRATDFMRPALQGAAPVRDAGNQRVTQKKGRICAAGRPCDGRLCARYRPLPRSPA